MTGTTSAKTLAKAPRVYLSSAEREAQIVQAAIGFFAENGFGGNTRELAQRLGVAHGLLFKYFPTKEALIERVYKELFSGHWDPRWEETLRDRSQPLQQRLFSVYTSYADRINRYEWVRIYLFAGLNGTKINARYWNLVRDKIMSFVIDELRFEHDKPPLAQLEATPAELEFMWGLHAAVFYLGVRKWVYQLPDIGTKPATILQLVEGFMDAAPRVMNRTPVKAARRRARPNSNAASGAKPRARSGQR